MIYTVLYFNKLKMGDIYKYNNKEYTIIASIDHECGEGFALAYDNRGDLYIFCELEGGFSGDYFNLSEVMRKTVIPPEMWENILDSIWRKE
jgi:hypothetical protein